MGRIYDINVDIDFCKNELGLFERPRLKKRPGFGFRISWTKIQLRE